MTAFPDMNTTSPASDWLRDKVRNERIRRGWSIRHAAERSHQESEDGEAGVSNTTWGRYEETGHLTAEMRRAIIAAFGWSAEWAEGTPMSDGDDLSRLLADLAAEVLRLRRLLDDQSDATAAALESILERLDRLERPGEQVNDR
jgi:hypothetical protein